jgi:predicted nucleic acid-binding protein
MDIYCDSVILIYYLDSVGPFQVRAATRLASMKAAGDSIAVSDFTRLECKVGPLKRSDALMLSELDRFFTSPDVRVIPLTAEVFDRAAMIRAEYGFRTADALHLAAAIVGRCDRFLTHDARLARFADLPVEVL